MVLDKVANIRDLMRQTYYRKKINNFRVSSAEKLLGWEEDPGFEAMDAFWGSDPVHLSAAGYRKMASSLADLGVSQAGFCNTKAKRGLDRSTSRSAWVGNNQEVVAQRPSPDRCNNRDKWIRGRPG